MLRRSHWKSRLLIIRDSLVKACLLGQLRVGRDLREGRVAITPPSKERDWLQHATATCWKDRPPNGAFVVLLWLRSIQVDQCPILIIIFPCLVVLTIAIVDHNSHNNECNVYYGLVPTPANRFSWLYAAYEPESTALPPRFCILIVGVCSCKLCGTFNGRTKVCETIQFGTIKITEVQEDKVTIVINFYWFFLHKNVRPVAPATRQQWLPVQALPTTQQRPGWFGDLLSHFATL